MTLVSVPCAVCNGRDFASIFPGTITELDAEPEAFFSSSRSSAGYLPIVRCRACGLVQSNPRDDVATLASVYERLADHVYDTEDANRDFDAKAHLALVARNQKPPGRLLDVGCATGIFVARAAEAGFQTVGLDASRWAIDRARNRAPHAMFEAGTLESVRLEHVDSPKLVLEQVRGLLRPGGAVFLSMPNAASIVAKVMGRNWVLLLREHLWYFSPETIRRLLVQSGFAAIEHRSKSVSFSLANVAGRLSQYRGPLASAASKLSENEVLRSASIRFPMGEMDVVARRSD
jgi:SAM-dependent methyltransferase